jgi:hypothetical protein
MTHDEAYAVVLVIWNVAGAVAGVITLLWILGLFDKDEE